MNIDSSNLKVHLISGAVLILAGFFSVGLAFAQLFMQGRGGNLINLIIVILCVSPIYISYILVKKYKVAWWFPAATIISPSLVLFIATLINPHSNSAVFILPILMIAALILPPGRMGLKHRVNNA